MCVLGLSQVPLALQTPTSAERRCTFTAQRVVSVVPKHSHGLDMSCLCVCLAPCLLAS
jgi:hypothetical protein